MTDDELIDAVRAAFESYEPVPVAVLDAAQAAFQWRAVEAELARLTADTDRLPAGVRGGGARILTFVATDLSLEIEITGTERGVEIAGQLIPPAPADIKVRHPAGELRTRAGDTGQFVLPEVPAGPVSLMLRLPDESSIVTSWIRL